MQIFHGEIHVHLSMLSFQNHSTSTCNALRRHLESIPRSELEAWKQARKKRPSTAQGQIICYRMARHESISLDRSKRFSRMR